MEINYKQNVPVSKLRETQSNLMAIKKACNSNKERPPKSIRRGLARVNAQLKRAEGKIESAKRAQQQHENAKAEEERARSERLARERESFYSRNYY